MTDVRLTATNPEDSSVVPVACNEKGELILEEPGEGPPGEPGPPGPPGEPGDPFTGNFEGDVTFTGGNATFAGNVGIGTDAAIDFGSTWRTLEVSGDSGGVIRSTATGGDDGDISFDFYAQPTNAIIRTTTETPISFITNEQTQMRILPDGNVGIGTSAPASKLQVASGTRFVSVLDTGVQNWGGLGFTFSSGNNAYGAIMGYELSFRVGDYNDPANYANTKEGIRIKSDGNVGIGTISPTSPLDVGGKCGFLNDGGIWMTDKRGNTYRTDFVSNGMMTWIEYTPPAQRDQLEALGDRIEELGQSTQDGTTTDIDDPRLK